VASLPAEDLKRIAPFVSSLEAPVFALAGLPEEVIAVLFAYYSRSKDDLRTNLARLLSDEALDVVADGTAPGAGKAFHLATEKARTFHEKWVVGYGHASVAEHAVVHLAIEGVSIVASKAIEDMRLASYTEKSTRYVLFDEGSFHELPELPAALAARYHDAARNLFRTYLALVPKVEAEVRRRVPQGEKQAPRAYDAAVRAKTFDLLRGLLPAGTKTNLGLTLNARALENGLSKMLSSPLDEVRAVAGAMHREAATVAPTLLKYVAPNEFRSRGRATFPNAVLEKLAAPGALSVPASDARLLRHDSDALQRIAFALASEGNEGREAGAELLARIGRADEATLAALVRSALDGRGRFDGAPRAFEASSLLFDLVLDYGAYRDMQRHRMLSPYTARLGCELGAEVPAELAEMGVAGEFEAALAQAESAWRALAATHPWEAQYVVPLAYRVRTTWQMNVRELFHVVELRSAKQGHISYRRLAQALHREALAALPWLAGLVRVDDEAYSLPRA
jgi:thymidylate synthase ThyX